MEIFYTIKDEVVLGEARDKVQKFIFEMLQLAGSSHTVDCAVDLKRRKILNLSSLTVEELQKVEEGFLVTTQSYHALLLMLRKHPTQSGSRVITVCTMEPVANSIVSYDWITQEVVLHEGTVDDFLWSSESFLNHRK